MPLNETASLPTTTNGILAKSSVDSDAIRQRFAKGVKFLGLHAPSLIKRENLASIVADDEANLHGMHQAKQEAKDLDIVVTGASDIDDPNSTLHDFFKNNLEARDQLEAAGCVGHLLYLPLAASGPIPLSRQRYLMPTAMDLTDLQALVKANKRVMVVSGPQFKTLAPKRVVATILGQEKALVTDLIVDARTAKYALDNTHAAAPGHNQSSLHERALSVVTP